MESPSIRLKMDKASFDEVYNANLSTADSNKDAYEATEQKHEELTGGRMYSSYDSYRHCRKIRIKKRR